MFFSFILAKRNCTFHIKNNQLKRGKRRKLQFRGAIWTSAGSYFTLQCFISPSPLNNSHCLPHQLLGKKKKSSEASHGQWEEALICKGGREKQRVIADASHLKSCVQRILPMLISIRDLGWLKK